MFNFLKSKKDIPPNDVTPGTVAPKQSWLERLRNNLKKTRENLGNRIADLMLGKKVIDDQLFEELETILLLADVGVNATRKIMENLSQRVKRNELSDPQALMLALRELLLSMLMPYTTPIQVNHKPYVFLMVGVNGAGKTTTIAKLAHYYQQQQNKIMLAAGDTFRAAAVEQLQIWGDRNQVPVIAQHTGADSASVIFDALQSASARDIDILIADTAGRLHTQEHLMTELQKIKRVMKKINPQAPHEIMLVLDAGTGQNAIHQAREFHEAVGLTGITLTKLDGTAKGGIIFAITEEMKLPIRFIGFGENIEDLKPFNPQEFIDVLFQNKADEIK